MVTMISARVCAAIAAGTLLSGAGLGTALAQSDNTAIGKLYSFHSRPSGDCPSLDWHVVVESNNTLSGFIATDDMKNVFRVSGSLGAGNKFHLDGKEIGGSGRTGTVDGQVRTDGWLIANIGNITGPSPCSNHTVIVQWYRFDLSPT